MGKYATGTEVPESQSRAEIERTLVKYGAGEYMYGWRGGSGDHRFQNERANDNA